MKKQLFTLFQLKPKYAAAPLLLLLTIGSCHKANVDDKVLRDFQQVNLVANSASYAPALTDPTLLNAWGIAWSPTGIAWVNSLGGHVSELYTADGAIVRPPVNIPSPADSIGGLPTGIVFAGGAGFTLANKQPAAFLFVGVDGVLSGWNGADGNNAQRIANNSSTSSYTGLAINTVNGHHILYGANFKAGRIDVWDTTFAPVSMTIRDPQIPSGFSPFNIQSVDGQLFVMYAKVGPDGRDQSGAGLGFVSVFRPDGVFIRRFASKGTLDAPWGVVMAPANFLEDHDMEENHGGNGGNDNSGPGNNNGENNGGNDNSGPGNNNGNNNNGNNNNGNNNGGQDDVNHQPVILVGNFGDGHINVFSLSGDYRGQLQTHNRTIVINGLWSLSFAPTTATTVDPKRLYFTAGPNLEADGLFGYLVKP